MFVEEDWSLLESFASYLERVGRAHSTRTIYVRAAEQLCGGVCRHPGDLTVTEIDAHLLEWRSEFKRQHDRWPSAATYRNRVAALRAFYEWMERFDLLRAHDGMLRPNPMRWIDAPRVEQIPALDVEAPVVPVGVDRETREMELPPDNATAAWYRYGASPGGEGSAVIAGHVDYGEGQAVFFRLAELEPGNRMVVGYGDGSTAVFRVVARRLVGKDELPARIFSTRGRPLLTLVTCGGAYDAARRHYLGNTLVFAVPV